MGNFQWTSIEFKGQNEPTAINDSCQAHRFNRFHASDTLDHVNQQNRIHQKNQKNPSLPTLPGMYPTRPPMSPERYIKILLMKIIKTEENYQI